MGGEVESHEDNINVLKVGFVIESKKLSIHSLGVKSLIELN